jgi:hypothetical protein
MSVSCAEAFAGNAGKVIQNTDYESVIAAGITGRLILNRIRQGGGDGFAGIPLSTFPGAPWQTFCRHHGAQSAGTAAVWHRPWLCLCNRCSVTAWLSQTVISISLKLDFRMIAFEVKVTDLCELRWLGTAPAVCVK